MDNPDSVERMERQSECALWYWTHGSLQVEVCPDEADAVNAALGMIEYNTGAPEGVSFPDGRAHKREDWPAYIAEQERQHAAMMAEVFEQPSRPSTPPIEVQSPFGPKMARVLDPPTWLVRR